jgi:hypothetical protein
VETGSTTTASATTAKRFLDQLFKESTLRQNWALQCQDCGTVKHPMPKSNCSSVIADSVCEGNTVPEISVAQELNDDLCLAASGTQVLEKRLVWRKRIDEYGYLVGEPLVRQLVVPNAVSPPSIAVLPF